MQASTTCDWWTESRGPVDANAQSRRVTSASSTYLSFLFNVPRSRLSHVHVQTLSLLVSKRPVLLCFSETHDATMVKIAKVRLKDDARFVYGGRFFVVLTKLW